MNTQDHRVFPFRGNSIAKGSVAGLVKKLILAAFILVAAIFLFGGPKAGRAAPGSGANPQTAQTPTGPRERFDYLVRADFFAGFAGDQAAFERGMKVCTDTLAKSPNHAEALVWHGGGLLFIAGQAFQKADFRKGTELWDAGLKEMDRAVELEPNNVGVLIPRGASLLEASRYVSDKAAQRALLEKAVGDYEKVLELQKPYFQTLSGHARGELLYGLAEGWIRLGNTDKARAYFQRIANECKDSGRQPQAAAWLEKGTVAGTEPMSCTGCHKR